MLSTASKALTFLRDKKRPGNNIHDSWELFISPAHFLSQCRIPFPDLSVKTDWIDSTITTEMLHLVA